MAHVAGAPQVLIVSNRLDAHVPLVTRHFEVLGVPFFVLNTETFGRDVVGSAFIGDSDRLALHEGEVEIDLQSVRAVWYRRPELPEMTHLASQEARRFAQEEEKAFLDGMLACLECRWLSHPAAIREGRHRLKQLRMAREVGFSVPPTLISQLPGEIREFESAVGGPLAAKLIAKGPPKALTPDDQYVVFTQKLTERELEDADVLATCATLYQPYVEKQFELRVTVVGDEVFACRIDSQVTERTRLDWRRYDLHNTPHRVFELDPETRERCLDLVRRLGLNFGAIDLICTPDDEIVFLEINPNGQWGWIEELTGLPIAQAHARFLSDR